MATVKLLISLVAIELIFKYHQVGQDTWFIGYALIFGMWIIGDEIGRMANSFWKIEHVAKDFLDELESDGNNGGESNGKSVQE